MSLNRKVCRNDGHSVPRVSAGQFRVFALIRRAYPNNNDENAKLGVASRIYQAPVAGDPTRSDAGLGRSIIRITVADDETAMNRSCPGR